MNNQIPVSSDYLFAKIGRLVVENEYLHQEIARLQQLLQQAQQANGKEPDAPGEAVEVAERAKAVK